MPLVGSQHADGARLGAPSLAAAGLVGREAANCLAPFLYDENSLSIPRRLFDGESLARRVRQETW